MRRQRASTHESRKNAQMLAAPNRPPDGDWTVGIVDASGVGLFLGLSCTNTKTHYVVEKVNRRGRRAVACAF